jgi:hypothetical protein
MIRIQQKNNEYDKLRINKARAEQVDEGDERSGRAGASALARR